MSTQVCLKNRGYGVDLEITPQEYEQRFVEFFNRCNAEGHYLHYCAIEKSLWREQAVREGEMEESMWSSLLQSCHR